jgi:hypothetical protein
LSTGRDGDITSWRVLGPTLLLGVAIFIADDGISGEMDLGYRCATWCCCCCS